MSETPALQRFLEAREQRAPRLAVEAGVQACGELTALLDAAISELAAALISPNIAVVAVGGYGRREQSPHSDIDVMLLAEEEAQGAAAALLYPLWDAKLTVGHSIRDVGQTISAANERVETATALLDARLVTGNPALFERFREAQRHVASRQIRWLAAELAKQRKTRVAAERWQLASPQLKTGRGGLRDLHAPRWLDRMEVLARRTDAPTVTERSERAEPLEAERETLLATRTALHALSERPGDRLFHDLAPAVADWLGEESATWSRRLLAALRTIDDAAATRLDGPAAPARPASGPRRWIGTLRRARRGADDGPTSITTPAAEGVGETQQHLAAALGALGTAGGNTGDPGAAPPSLEPLPPAPWLTELLPEWEGLRYRQHAVSFHLHPVDIHAARSVAEAWRAARIEEEDTGTVDAATALADEGLLLLAALLHDIGKGDASDHAEVGAVVAERVAARLRLDAERSRRLVTAVRHHLLLPTIATRRDIADTRVIAEVAQAVGDARTLHLLYVLSVADARATGPHAWGRWKGQLMRRLHRRVLAQIDASGAGERAPDAAALARREGAIAAVAALDGGPAIEIVRRHVNGLPPDYALNTPPAEIATHLNLISAAARATAATALERGHVGGVERLTVVTRDHPGVLTMLAGTLAVHSATVLGGTCYTREDGWAIDVVGVDDALGHGIDATRWARIEQNIPLALSGEFPIDRRLIKTRAVYADRPRGRGEGPRRSVELNAPPIETTVRVDNAGSESYSIVEVSVADRLGILYAITRALNRLGLNIHLAKVDTWGAEVVDAFYVQHESGRRIEEPEEIDRLRTQVIAAIAALDNATDDGESAN